LEKTPSFFFFNLRAHYGWTIEHWKRTPGSDLSPVSVLVWIWKDCHGELNIIPIVRRRKKELYLGEGMITIVGQTEASFLNKSTCKVA
jgi:hypothetical protein